jgi:hypothetical protein
MDHLKALTKPNIRCSRSAVFAKLCPVPTASGVYAWFFKEIPSITPTDGCIAHGGLTMLYAGISPKNEISSENICKRNTYYYRGNAEGSTLRLTLGVLLSDQSGFPLRRVGSGKRMTFTHLGEQWLDDWMDANAFVCWVKHPEPWALEAELLQTLSLPLNIDQNGDHAFTPKLRAMRKEAKRLAREQPIAHENNQQRLMPNEDD